MADVVEQVFQEALRRDPERRRQWVVLVDGQDQQLNAVKAAAKRHGVAVRIVCDFIHTLEYLWKASHCFHPAGSSEARQWVCDHARSLLEGGDPSQVAAGMRRSATLRSLAKRKAVDKAARYLIRRRAYMGMARHCETASRSPPESSRVRAAISFVIASTAAERAGRSWARKPSSNFAR